MSHNFLQFLDHKKLVKVKNHKTFQKISQTASSEKKQQLC